MTLVLAGAYAGWTGSLPPDVAEDRLQLSLKLAELPPDEFAAKVIPTLFPDTTPADVVDDFAAIVSEIHPAGFPVMARSLAEADLRGVLSRITVPTLLLYGEKDVRAPLQVAEALHASIPRSKLVILPGIGHMSNFEAGEPFNQEVRAFLKST